MPLPSSGPTLRLIRQLRISWQITTARCHRMSTRWKMIQSIWETTSPLKDLNPTPPSKRSSIGAPSAPSKSSSPPRGANHLPMCLIRLAAGGKAPPPSRLTINRLIAEEPLPGKKMKVKWASNSANRSPTRLLSNSYWAQASWKTAKTLGSARILKS